MFLTCLLSRYQIMILELLFLSTSERQTMNWSPHLDESAKFQCIEIHVPNGVNVSENTEYASQAALWGIEVHYFQGFPELGEIYPLGGAGDRLGLLDSDTSECLIVDGLYWKCASDLHRGSFTAPNYLHTSSIRAPAIFTAIGNQQQPSSIRGNQRYSQQPLHQRLLLPLPIIV